MPCCGKSRTSPRPAPGGPRSTDRGEPQARAASQVFEYIGASGLTATGPVTGRRYIFFAHGARVIVDGRDVPGMRKVPLLRQV